MMFAPVFWSQSENGGSPPQRGKVITMINQITMQRMKKSRIGRVVRRLLGEERGAIMMEYVILAVLIAAAAVVAVAMFGKTIVGMFDSAARGATGDHTGAKSAQDATRSTQTTDAKAAKSYHDSMHQ